MIVLGGYPADCEGFEGVPDYACTKEVVLREFPERPCGIPSQDTLNRVVRRLDPTQLEALLTKLGKDIVGLLAQKQLIIVVNNDAELLRLVINKRR